LEEGYKFLESMKPPFVLKADGLAAGKGVLILDNLEEAKAELKSMLADAKFGDASSRVVIEQFLKGIELSVFVITDGEYYKILPEAKDYKRIGEGDAGLNTGGMGAVSPVSFADKTFMDKVENQIIIPTVKGLKAENIVYKGFIFFGLIAVKGEPYVIEYNCRLGDPETEVILPRLQTDLVSLLAAADNGTLEDVNIQYHDEAFATVMAVSGGYPGSYQKNFPIQGIEAAQKLPDTLVFQAGTGFQDNSIVTKGGRVLTVTANGTNLQNAVQKAQKGLSTIQFEGMNFRKDIGYEFS
jgi:phosphoribosylamine--glycine ligase